MVERPEETYGKQEMGRSGNLGRLTCLKRQTLQQHSVRLLDLERPIDPLKTESKDFRDHLARLRLCDTGREKTLGRHRLLSAGQRLVLHL